MEAQDAKQVQAKDVDATVDSVLKDAEKRSKMLQMEGFTAGWSEGNFKLQSADGSFSMVPELQLQFRYIFNYRDDTTVATTDDEFDNGSSDITKGFEVARAKLGFSGNAFSKDLTYNIRFVTGSAYEGTTFFSDSPASSNSGGLQLENAYVQYQFADNMAVKMGQWKDNVYHEENVEDVNQLAVDRSLVNELIGGGVTDYVQGVALVYNDKNMPLRGEVAFHDGIDTGNTSFTNVGGGSTDPDFNNGKTNFGFSGRAEYALMGGFKDYATMTTAAMWGNKAAQDLLVLGGGFDWTQSGSTDALFFTFDAQWEPVNVAGLAVYGGFLGLYTSGADTVTGDEDFLDWGFLVQAGYMLNEKWEIFGRVDYTGLDSDRDLPEDEIWEITVGANYYWHGQGAKFTIDANFLPNGSPGNVPTLGYLPGSDTSIVVRAQVQLAI
jgi:hypothetical protein